MTSHSKHIVTFILLEKLVSFFSSFSLVPLENQNQSSLHTEPSTSAASLTTADGGENNFIQLSHLSHEERVRMGHPLQARNQDNKV